MSDWRFPSDDDVVLPRLLRRAAAADPSRVFAVFQDGGSWTYSDMEEAAAASARGLDALGVALGDTVASMLPNGREALRVWFGVNALGAVLVPLNTAYRGQLLERAINGCDARILVVHQRHVHLLLDLTLDHLQFIIVVGGSTADVRMPPGITALPDEALRKDGPSLPLPDLTSSALFLLLHTSGTTGPAKLVRCTYLHHHTYCEGVLPTQDAGDRAIISTSLSHVAATTLIYGMLQRGGSVAMIDRFGTSAFWDDVRRTGATHATLVGAMATFLMKAPRHSTDRDNPLRTVLVTPMVPDSQGFSERFGLALFSAYGGTEITCPLRSAWRPTDHRSCGREWNPAFQLRLVDRDDREVPLGDAGELVVRHDRPWSLNDGYYGMPAESHVAWRNGWFHTGDVLRKDVAGNYYFIDRLKDVVRRRGENVSSAEVESELLQHEAILEAAVVGFPAREGEEEVRAFIVPQHAQSIDVEELSRWLVGRLPYFMVPRYFDIVSELPHTDTQKVQKSVLRKRALGSDTWDREAHGLHLRQAEHG